MCRSHVAGANADGVTETRRNPPKPAETRLSGVKGDRTPDLVNAIHALSQLSYDPLGARFLLVLWGAVKPRPTKPAR